MKIRGNLIKSNSPQILALAAGRCCERIAKALTENQLRFTGAGWVSLLPGGTRIEIIPDEEPAEDIEKFRLLRELFLVCKSSGRGWEWEWRELCEDLVSQLFGNVSFEDRFRDGKYADKRGQLIIVAKGKYQAHGCGCAVTIEFGKAEIFC